VSDALSLAIAELKRDEAPRLVKERLARGDDPLEILEACRDGMTLVGDRFREGDYFLAQLLLSARIFKGAAALLEPHLTATGEVPTRGRVVLATLKGDIHDLGKNILATLLRAHAFEVHDLGVGVEPKLLVERVRELSPEFVGFSTLITVAFDSMKRAAELLAEAGLREQLQLMIGGGVTTPMLAEQIGADFQTTDAAEGVDFCVKMAAEHAHGR
jgi:methanogenic corrinoid protein MtbC1